MIIKAKEEDILKGIDLLYEKGYILRSDIIGLNSRGYSRNLLKQLAKRLDFDISGEHVELDGMVDYYEIIYIYDHREEAIDQAKKEMIRDLEETKDKI